MPFKKPVSQMDIVKKCSSQFLPLIRDEIRNPISEQAELIRLYSVAWQAIRNGAVCVKCGIFLAPLRSNGRSEPLSRGAMHTRTFERFLNHISELTPCQREVFLRAALGRFTT